METGTIESLAWKMVVMGAVLLVIVLLINLLLHKKGLVKSSNKINTGLSGSGLQKSTTPSGFIFGKLGKSKVFLDSKSEGHIAVFGGSGKGKTSALLIPTLRAWDAPCFVIDISGDITKNVKVDGKMVISPSNPSEGCVYNIFHLIDKEAAENEKRELLEQLVNTIIDIPAKANDAHLYFATTARKIFLSAVIAFYDIGMDFIDICKTIFFHDVMELAELVKITENKLAWGYMTSLIGENEKNIAGAKSMLNDKIKIFSDNEKMEALIRRPRVLPTGELEETFYPEVLEHKKVFLKIPDKKQEVYAALMRVITGQILDYISGRNFDKNEDRRILLGLDEMASLGHLNIVPPFRKFRKNGANIAIFTQSLADLDLVYDVKERQVILDNTQYVVVLNAMDNSTREYFSNLVGKEEKKNTSTSVGKQGKSTSTSMKKDYAIAPEEWKDYGEELIVIHPAGYTKLKKNYYYKEAGIK